MPIRHCQKCGLKVLIDESQAQTSVFYCQRCTTAMKSQEAAAMEAAVAVRPQTPVPSAPVMSAPKPVTVKVLCPYCKASFNGRVPQKPARGACPVCQKELILLPDGEIRPAAGFDLSRWQQEQKDGPGARGGEPAETGTKVLVKKYAADSAKGGTRLGIRKAAAAAAEPVQARSPEPPAATDPADTGSGDEPSSLPDWLDDASSSAKGAAAPQEEPAYQEPEPVTVPEESPPEPEPAPLPEPESAPVQLDDLPQTGPPLDDAVPDVPAPVDAESEPQPVTAALLPPPPAPAKSATAVPRKGTGVIAARKTDRRVAPAAIGGAPATGAGKILLAYLLLILPLVAGPVLHGAQEKVKGTPVEKLGVRFKKGFLEIYHRLQPPAAAPKPPPEEKKVEAPPEEKPKPGPAEQAQLEREITDLHLKYMREKRTYDQKMKGATEAEKKEFEPVAERLKKEEERIRALREDYKKWFGKDFDPANQ